MDERTHDDMAHIYSNETQTIDTLLTQACWTLQSRSNRSPARGSGVAIRSRAQVVARQEPYLLAVDGQVLGVVHVVPECEGVIGFERRTRSDELRLPSGLRCAQPLLPYTYYSNGSTTAFTNWLESDAPARRVSGFHRPETLVRWLTGGSPVQGGNAPGQLQRALLRRMHTHPLPQGDACHLAALERLDQSLSDNHQRTLLTLETGMDRLGVAYACAERMVRLGGTRSLLFLVSQPPVLPPVVERLSGGAAGEADALDALAARHRALLSAGAVYSLEEARVFVCDVEHMARRLAGSPPQLPLEAFDTVFAYGLADEGQQDDLGRILAYFDAVIVGFSHPSPCRASVEMFHGNVYVPTTPESGCLQLIPA
jgi:type I restriction enzyme R subunit